MQKRDKNWRGAAGVEKLGYCVLWKCLAQHYRAELFMMYW